MKLSYVIATQNRRDMLLHTLAMLEKNTHLPRHLWEVFVVDNASSDGTPEAIVRHHREVNVIRLPENEGVPAANHALAPARGRFVIFLDDDSFPLNDAIPRSLAYLSRHPRTGALVARGVLPDGSGEAPALPSITLGGASIIRRSVLDDVGGYAPESVRQTGEYDLSFRIWRAGYRIERFEDIRFGRNRAEPPRHTSLTRRMDLRNNMILLERYLPREQRRAYRHDWLRRYAALGTHEGHVSAINAAICEARVWARREQTVGRKPLDAAALEAVFQWDAQTRAVAAWRETSGARRVAIADVSKNLYATWRACRAAKLEISAILENAPAFTQSTYRGVPVLPDSKAKELPLDGIILSNTCPAAVERRMQELKERTGGTPVLKLWEPRLLSDIEARNRVPLPPRDTAIRPSSQPPRKPKAA